MRITISILVLSVWLTVAYGQKVNIDNHRVYVEYSTLPIHKTTPDQRTFSLHVSGNYEFDKQEIANSLNLRGWEYVPDGGQVFVKLKISEFIRGKASYSKEIKEKKSKGKVVSRTPYYTYSSVNTGRAHLAIYGPINKYVPPRRKSKSKKKQAKRDKKKKEQEKAIADNPFLQGVDVKEESGGSDSELSGTYNLTQRYKVESEKYTSIRKARKDYNDKVNEAYATQLDKYANVITKRTNHSLNQTYGYNKKRDWVRFKKLGSKKHPEYDMYKNATGALKLIFAKKKFNNSFEDVVEAIKPISDYFESVIEKYNKDDKHEKKLKAASMYNLAQIYYYLDQPDKVIEIGNEYIKWDYDKKDGARFIEKGERLKHLLAFHEVTGRYFKTDEDPETIEAETSEEEEGDEGK